MSTKGFAEIVIRKNIPLSNDGGIAGYGYYVVTNDFGPTKMVIQCKRYIVARVSESETNQFLGAMN